MMQKPAQGRRTTSTTRTLHATVVAFSILAVLAGSVFAGQADRGFGPVIHRAAENNPEFEALLKDYASPLFVPAADFRTDGLYPEAQSYSLSGYWKGDSLGGVYLMAPIWLPHGAVINSVWLFAVDDDDSCSSQDVTLWMQRVDNYTGSVDAMATMSTTGSTTNMQTPYEGNPTHPTIAYPDFSYWLTVRVCSLDHELYGAMIFYD